VDPDSGKMNWYFQYTPGDMWDYDEVGTHILIDRTVDGQPRKLVTHSARNGFVYTMERNNGAMVGAKPYMEVTGPRASTRDRQAARLRPGKDVQTYSGIADPTKETRSRGLPQPHRRQQLLSVRLQPKTQLLYIPATTECEFVTNDATW